MDARQEIERRIERERQKLTDLRAQIERTESFILGMQEAVKLLPRVAQMSASGSKRALRSGGSAQQALQLLRTGGKPMHISDILIAIGKENTRSARSSLASSLGRYSRQGKLFVNEGSNTFSAKAESDPSGNLPEEFGMKDPPKTTK